MTPFGARLRELRRERGIEQKDMARALGVSASYLSALEHGRRGKPGWPMVQKIIGYFNVIWDEAEELQCLAEQSDPRVVVDTSGLPPEHTALANRLARLVPHLTSEEVAAIADLLPRDREPVRGKAPRGPRSAR